MDRNIKKILTENRTRLEASAMDLKSIYEIMFRLEEDVLCEGNDGFRTWKLTYGQVRRRIEDAARGLYGKIGSTHGYVALEMENGPEWIVAFWAILMSGNKPYLVNTRYPASLTEGILKTLNVRYNICLKDSELSPETIVFSSLECGAPAMEEDVFEDEIAFSSSATSMNEVICFYSGYQISQQILNFRGIVKECPRIAKHYKGQLKQLAFLPFYHVFGLFAVYFWFTFFGRTLVFLRDYGADTILKTCRRHNVTHIFAVPMLWHTVEKKLLATVKEQGQEKKFQRGRKLATRLQNLFPNRGPELAKYLLRKVTDRLFGRSVMFCINGGSYLRDSAMELLNSIGYSMHNGYGMSEIGITSVELRKTPAARNLNSIGHPFQSVEYRLDENGILEVRGSSLCIRKLINGQEVVLSDWFSTGDYMTVKDGHYFIQGRQGDVVIGENGENINPDTVEKLFLVADALSLCVLGLPQKEGEELSIVVQLNPFASAKTVEKVKNEIYAINGTLPAASAIRKFYFTYDEMMPANAVKVSRAQLKKKIEAGAVNLTAFSDLQVSTEIQEDTSPLMQEVCRIVAQVLETEPEKVAPDTHIFFDLGATSIQYFSILTALAERFSITEYEKGDSYRYTPREICRYLERYL